LFRNTNEAQGLFLSGAWLATPYHSSIPSADLVAHSGLVARGSFVQTLVLTDIATGWTECAPLLVREQRLLTEVLGEMFCESD
jgi:hypothetical protein